MLTTSFERWGAAHLAALFLIAVATGVLAWLAPRLSQRSKRNLERMLATLLFAVEVSDLLYYSMPSRFDIQSSLPLHFCDFVCISTIIALVFKSAWAKAVTFYCGLTLTLLATLTPTLALGFPSFRFLSFFSNHGLIIAIAIYLYMSGDLVPSIKSMLQATRGTLQWALFVSPFNLLYDTNYFFLMRLPNSRSFLNYLGPWPGYLIATLFLLMTVWTFLTLLFRKPRGVL